MGQAYLEVTYDHTGENDCDMAILAYKVLAVPRHDTVTVCMKTIEN